MIFKPLAGLIVKAAGGIPTDSLVAYYPFNGNSNDESGNGWDATGSTITYTTDRNGNANSAGDGGGSQGVTLNYTTLFNVGTNPFTITGWFNRDTNTASRLISFFGTSIANAIQLRFNVSDLRMRVFVRDNASAGVSNVQVPVDLSLNTWYFFALRKKADNSVDITINDTNYSLGSTTGTVNLDSGNKNIFSDGIVFFDGQQDQYRFYNRELTDSEITALYNE